MATKLGLKEFASTQRFSCAICELSPAIRKEIAEAWAAGVRAAAVKKWLEEELKIKFERPISMHNIRNHIMHEERRNAQR